MMSMVLESTVVKSTVVKGTAGAIIADIAVSAGGAFRPARSGSSAYGHTSSGSRPT
jgi:hypothetical protein